MTTMSQLYPQRFFALQLDLAQRVAQLASAPIEDAVLRYTALYRILGLDWSFDPGDPVWQAYLGVLRADGPDAAGTHQFYLDRSDVIPRFAPGPRWGCFSYDYYDSMRAVHLHFGNLDEPEPGALSAARKEVRLGELGAMFAAIRREHPDVQSVRGHSWLYNREGYRRLFPPSYLASAMAERPNLQARSVWGQFLQSDWQVNEETARAFEARVMQLSHVHEEAVVATFPYRELAVTGPIAAFYQMYGIA
jgi:hypothetical protein